MDDRFIGLGVTECLAGQTLHCFGVAPQCVKVLLQLSGRLAFMFQFGVQLVNLPAHLLVLLDEWQVGHANKQQSRNGHEYDDRLREPAPNAEIHFHRPSVTPRGAEVKADFMSKRILLSSGGKWLMLVPA